MNQNKWKSVAIPIEIHDLLREMATMSDRPISRQLTHIIKLTWQARHFDGDVENMEGFEHAWDREERHDQKS